MLISVKKIFTPQKRILQFYPAALIVAIVIGLAFTKVGYVERLTSTAIGEVDIHFGLLALKHDLVIFVWVIALFLGAAMVRQYVISTLMKLLSVCILITWSADIIVIKYFATRLTFSDTLKFIGEWNTIGNFMTQAYHDKTWAVMLLTIITGLLLLYYILTDVKPLGPHAFTTAAVIPLFLVGINFSGEKTLYVHSWTYRNFFEINAKQGISKSYSDVYIRSLESAPDRLGKRADCIPGRRDRPNLILVLFESLSMYHSQYFSGMPSMAPNFDRIARENISYTNFFSNGWTTEAGMISIFTGKHLIPPPIDYASASWDFGFSYGGFHLRDGSLPDLFNQNEYFTAFMTTGNLRFLQKGDWLKNIGFKYIEGSEQKFYDGWPRHHFNAAPDDALYRRVLQYLPLLEERAPYMLTIETVSTHQPFLNPYDLSKSEASVFVMADKALGLFYDDLKANGFFKNGILVIVGDHRSMTGMKKEELNLYGKSAASRVPMVIAFGDGRAPQKIEAFSQQTDFIPSFEYLVGQRSCTGPLHGNFLVDPPIEAEYVLFPRGDNRDLVDAYTPKPNQGTFQINGDDTAMIDGMISDSNEIIRHIGMERIRISNKAF
jgi:phosphoglycerol transferase MdoB-like AlkP superfamily enzyme